MCLDDIRAIADPAERVRAANAALTRLPEQLRDIRRDAVREMRRTMTHRAVARELGISPTRVQQLEAPASPNGEAP